MRLMPPPEPQRVLTRCWWAWPFLVQVDVCGRHNEKPLSSRYFRTISPSSAPLSVQAPRVKHGCGLYFAIRCLPGGSRPLVTRDLETEKVVGDGPCATSAKLTPCL